MLLSANVIAFFFFLNMLCYKIIWGRSFIFSLGSAAEHCFPHCMSAGQTSTALLPPASMWHYSFQSQLPHPRIKPAFVSCSCFVSSSVQHSNVSGFNDSDRRPQRPVTALRCEVPFWWLRILGWWVEQPISHRVRDAGSVSQCANLMTSLGQTPVKSRTDRRSQIQEPKTWKTIQDACPH